MEGKGMIPHGSFDEKKRPWSKRVVPPKTNLNKPGPWAFNAELIERLKRSGCEIILLIEKGGGTRWSIPFAVFLEHSFPIHFVQDLQLACRDAYWQENTMESGAKRRTSHDLSRRAHQAPGYGILENHP